MGIVSHESKGSKGTKELIISWGGRGHIKKSTGASNQRVEEHLGKRIINVAPQKRAKKNTVFPAFEVEVRKHELAE